MPVQCVDYSDDGVFGHPAAPGIDPQCLPNGQSVGLAVWRSPISLAQQPGDWPFGRLWIAHNCSDSLVHLVGRVCHDDSAALQKARALEHLSLPVFFLGDLLLLLYYLPIYFQSVKGASPIESGVDNLPIVIAVAIFAVLGGVFVTSTGLPTPAMFVGALLGTIGCGLLYTLEIDTPSAKWIGYQILTGSAIAFSVQNGLNIAQASVDPEDMPAMTACLYFFQTVGGAFTVSSGQAAFVNQMLAKLPSSAPGVPGQKVVDAGASELRKVFSPEDLPGVLVAYMNGLKATFALSIAFCGIALIATFFVPWKRLATHAPANQEEGEQS